MNVVDSSGWVEYFTKGTNAKFFILPIQDVENLLVPSICIYEVFKRLHLDGYGAEDCAAEPWNGVTDYCPCGRENSEFSYTL